MMINHSRGGVVGVGERREKLEQQHSQSYIFFFFFFFSLKAEYHRTTSTQQQESRRKMKEPHLGEDDNDEDDEGEEEGEELSASLGVSEEDYHVSYRPSSLRDSPEFGTASSPITIDGGQQQPRRQHLRYRNNVRDQIGVKPHNADFIRRYSQSLPTSRFSNSDQDDEDCEDVLHRGSDAILRHRHSKLRSPDHSGGTPPHPKITNKAHFIHRQGSSKTPSSVERTRSQFKRHTPGSASKLLHKLHLLLSPYSSSHLLFTGIFHLSLILTQ